MATEAQIRANRENAKKSTGPRTAEGKARSAKNGLKHGLTSRLVVINEAEAEEFAVLEQKMLKNFQPNGEEELALVNRIIVCTWQLRRVPILEAQLLRRYAKMGNGNVAINLMRHNRFKEFLAISGYESRIDGALRQARRELRILRTSAPECTQPRPVSTLGSEIRSRHKTQACPGSIGDTGHPNLDL